MSPDGKLPPDHLGVIGRAEASAGDFDDAKDWRIKKWPLRRAAKFREETPRKGGGFAIKDRDTALQQYAGMEPCLQGSSDDKS